MRMTSPIAASQVQLTDTLLKSIIIHYYQLHGHSLLALDIAYPYLRGGNFAKQILQLEARSQSHSNTYSWIS